MADIPHVSVIIPTCDRPAHLDRALHSLEIQTRRDFEVVVVNDGETPVGAVLAKYADSLCPTLVERKIRRTGISAARNAGLAEAKGRRIAFLDDDDYFYDLHLEVLCGALDAANYLVVYGDALLAEQRDFGSGYETVSRRLPLSEDFDPRVLAFRNIVPTLCAVFDRVCLETAGAFAPYLRGHEDWDFWQRLARFFPFRHLPVITSEYTARVNAASLSTDVAVMRETWIFCRRQGALFQSVPAVYDLGRVAQAGKVLLRGGGECSVSVLLAPSRLDADAARHLVELLPLLGEAEPVLVLPDQAGAGDFIASLSTHCRRRPCVVATEGDVGRVYAAGLGAAAASGRVLIFLEEDVLPRPGAVAALTAFLEAEPSAGPAGGVLEGPGFRSVAGGRLTARGEPVFAAPAKDATGPYAVDLVPWPALAVRRDSFLQAGGLGTAFAPGHYADADLSLRLGQAGYSPHVVPSAVFSWNRGNLPIRQSPAGLIARRVFRDRHFPGDYAPERLLDGTDWSLRAAHRPSDGVMPESFEFTLPPRLR